MTIPITGQPVVPDLSDPDTFNTKSLNMFTWIMGSMLDQFNNVDPADFFAIQSGPMDATADRVLITGAGGLLQSGAGPLLANINATTIPGSLARFDGTTTGTKPAGVATGTVLTVRGAGTNNLSQLVLSGDGLQLWFRACVAGVFSAWRQPTPPELTQLQAENPASTVFGTVSGQRLAQAIDTRSPAFGLGQTSQNLVASRSWATTYQNTTGSAIWVCAGASASADKYGYVKPTAASIVNAANLVALITGFAQLSFYVPNGWYYHLTRSTGANSAWVEVRA